MIVEVLGATFAVSSDTAYDGFWLSVATGEWEPQTMRALAHLIGPGSRFVDVGAWVGPTTLFAAALGAVVDAYEPDPVALDGLRHNLGRNEQLAERVTVHPYALSAEDATLPLSADRLGESVSSLVSSGSSSRTVEVRSFQRERQRAHLANADVVKVDVEGAEFLFLGALAQYSFDIKPVILLSTHVRYLAKRFSRTPRVLRLVILQFLALRQLRVAWHFRRCPFWYEAANSDWTALDRWARIKRLVTFEDKEFLFAYRPVAV